jgi:hypothetical protein
VKKMTPNLKMEAVDFGKCNPVVPSLSDGRMRHRPDNTQLKGNTQSPNEKGKHTIDNPQFKRENTQSPTEKKKTQFPMNGKTQSIPN